VPSNRRYRQGWILVPALAFSAGLQGGGLIAYEALKPEPKPRLRMTVVSSTDLGDDAVLVSNERGDVVQQCRTEHEHCRLEVTKGTRLRIDAMPGVESTFEGFAGCESGADVLRCEIVVDANLDVTVRFGKQPERVDVAMIDDPLAIPMIEPPPPAPLPPTPEEIEAEKLEEPVEVAIVPPLPPDFVQPPLPPPVPPPPEQKKEPEKEQPPPPEMRMVEVPDENEVEDAPDDATHLSDKNRDVAEETAAKETNLEKEMTGEAPESAPSDVSSEEIGGAEDEIAQLESSESTTDQRVETSDRSGSEESAKGAVVGEEGEAGEEGTGEKKEPGMFSMRGIEGRGSVTEQGGDGKKEGKKGKEGMKTQLDFDDYERIVGKEKAEKERAIAKRDQSMKKGRYQKKLQAIKSALENFTPDVRNGNQTALKTKAHPFAVYVARMHRRIHELWGFGWLEDLDGKSADHPLNDFDLFTSIEVAVNPDGTVHKMTIVKGSGELEFDVAALHTIEAAGPYEQTPEKIRSVDQRVYLRWGFYRNWRQCGTFNVEPYILTEIANMEPLPEGMDVRDGGQKGGGQTVTEHDPERGTRAVTPEPAKGSGAAGDTTSHGHDKGDAQAEYAVNMWVAGFSTASVDRMLKVSALPFYAGAELAAQTQKDLRAVYEGLLVESGALKTWEVMTPGEYGKQTGSPVELAEGSLVLVVHAKESFAIVMTKTKSGDYRATMVVR
jgi:TonB family protein